jgi:Zn-dependent peptidase ImmA (M78 family)
MSHNGYIEKIATQALQRVDLNEIPVPVEKIAKVFGLEVVEFPFHNKISGLLKKEDGIIGVNQNHHPVRRRFTIAHELGHFLLGHGLGDVAQEEIIDDSFDKSHPQEREANQFAASLLMPSDLIKKEIKKNGMDVETLSKTFGVSKQAITIRLLDLKLI